MHRMHRCISSFFLSAALVAPVAIRADAQRPEDRQQEERHRDNKEQHKRYYDRAHKDWHDWDDREDHAYRGWLAERHRQYRGFSKLSRKDKDDYWNWRHSHPDSEGH